MGSQHSGGGTHVKQAEARHRALGGLGCHGHIQRRAAARKARLRQGEQEGGRGPVGWSAGTSFAAPAIPCWGRARQLGTAAGGGAAQLASRSLKKPAHSSGVTW